MGRVAVAVLAATAAALCASTAQASSQVGICDVLAIVLPLDCSPEPQPQPGTSDSTSSERVRRSSSDVRYDPERLTVTLRRATSRAAVDAALGRARVTLVRAVPAIDAYLVSVDPSRRTQALDSLRREPVVAGAGEEVLVEALGTPNDAAWPEQWGLRIAAVPQAWTYAQSTGRIVVAVVDTGVDPQQPDLAGVLVPGYDLVNGDASPDDDEGHGTAVAGVIAARTGNGIGIAGVCASCAIMPVKVLGADGSGDDSIVAAGIVWAADHGADVINLSLGGAGTTQALTDAIAYAAGKGIVIVAAAGNSASAVQFFPAADPNVLSVAATTQTDAPYPWSNFGAWVLLAAPGCNPALALGGSYGSFCGTSSATPLVAGLAGLALSVAPAAGPAAIDAAFEQSAVPIAGFVRYGRVDAAAALAKLGGTRVAAAVSLSGSVARGTWSAVRRVDAGPLSITVTFKPGRTLSLTVLPASGRPRRVSGRSPLRLTRVLPAGTLRLVVRGTGPRTRFAVQLKEVAQTVAR